MRRSNYIPTYIPPDDPDDDDDEDEDNSSKEPLLAQNSLTLQ